MALSTTEAEYMAMSTACQELIWLKSLYLEINGCQDEAWIIYSDNKGSINLAHNNVYHARSKHIDIRHHFVRDMIQRKSIIIQYISTEEMVADILTKALPNQRIQQLCQYLGLNNFKSSGGVVVHT